MAVQGCVPDGHYDCMLVKDDLIAQKKMTTGQIRAKQANEQ